jgi:hypothetical protein
VSVRQSGHLGSLTIDPIALQLNDQKEKDWHIDVEGDQFWFPFDHYTIVGHVEKTKIFLLMGKY